MLICVRFFFLVFVFFLMIRPPPTSTLFPYTTLFRSAWSSTPRTSSSTAPCTCSVMIITTTRRSEEHTSELQSLRHLVCRLLLEKKNIHYSAPEAVRITPSGRTGNRRLAAEQAICSPP